MKPVSSIVRPPAFDGVPTVSLMCRTHTSSVTSLLAHDRLAKLGLTAVLDTPDQMTAFVTGEVQKWGKAVKASGAQVD